MSWSAPGFLKQRSGKRDAYYRYLTAEYRRLFGEGSIHGWGVAQCLLRMDESSCKRWFQGSTWKLSLQSTNGFQWSKLLPQKSLKPLARSLSATIRNPTENHPLLGKNLNLLIMATRRCRCLGYSITWQIARMHAVGGFLIYETEYIFYHSHPFNFG